MVDPVCSAGEAHSLRRHLLLPTAALVGIGGEWAPFPHWMLGFVLTGSMSARMIDSIDSGCFLRSLPQVRALIEQIYFWRRTSCSHWFQECWFRSLEERGSDIDLWLADCHVGRHPWHRSGCSSKIRPSRGMPEAFGWYIVQLLEKLSPFLLGKVAGSCLNFLGRCLDSVLAPVSATCSL